MFAARDPANHLRIGRAFLRKPRDPPPNLHVPDFGSGLIAGHGNPHDATTSTPVATVAAVAAPAPPAQTSPADDNGNTSQSNAAASQVVDSGVGTGDNQAAPPANPSPGQASDSPPGSPTPGSGSSDPSITNPSVDSATTNGLVTSDSNPTADVPANADAPLATKSIADTTPTPTSPSTGFLTKPTIVSSSHPNSPNGNSDPSSTTTGSNVNSPAQHGISKGANVAIATILSLLLLGFLLFVLRRRSIVQRTERRQRWWFGRSGSNRNGNDNNPYTRGRDSPDSSTPRSGTLSTRSSFATTFDHGLTPASTVNFEGLIPALPPMAEVRGEPGSFVLGSGDRQAYPSPTSVPISVDSFDDHSRNFAHSASTASIPSDLSVQYHTAQPAAASTSNSDYLPILSSGDVTTPMSVRPFSPSESFAFPQPPGEQLSEMSSIHSRPQSTAMPKSPTAWSDNARTPPKVTPTPLIIAHTPEIPNSFVDPSSSSPAPSQVEFETFETIHRSFVPTRDNELRVSPGDSVRVLDMFNDGWALAEMVPSSGEGRGLIPIDCLRKLGQELPAFLEAKKVSSYTGYDGCEIFKSVN